MGVLEGLCGGGVVFPSLLQSLLSGQLMAGRCLISELQVGSFFLKLFMFSTVMILAQEVSSVS